MVLFPGSQRFSSTERHECDKCTSPERIVLNNHAWPLSTNHFRRSCGAADLEIYDNDSAAIRSLSHVQQLPSKMDCVVPFDFPPGCTTKTHLDEVISIVYRA
jgi:hypothetical protein